MSTVRMVNGVGSVPVVQIRGCDFTLYTVPQTRGWSKKMKYAKEHVTIVDRVIVELNRRSHEGGSLYLCCRMSDAWAHSYHALPPNARMDDFVDAFTDDMGAFARSINDDLYPHWWSEDMYGFYEERKAFITAYRAHIVNQMSIQPTDWNEL